jgi:predicted nucleic acid-binding protein
VIVDASVAMKWLVIEADSGAAISLLSRTDLAAPTLIHAEVGNAIWKKQRRGEFGDDPQLRTLPDRLSSMIETIDETSLLGRALEIAITVDHPIYDCIYLAVAESLDRELVTADERFFAKLAGGPMGSRMRKLGS